MTVVVFRQGSIGGTFIERTPDASLRFRCADKAVPLQQPCIYQGDNLLYHGILPALGRVVMLLQVGFEYLGDSVVETRREPSPEIAEQLVRRATGLPDRKSVV